VSENKGRWTTYHLNNNYQDNEGTKLDTSPKVDTTKVDTSENKVDSSINKVDSSKERLSKKELDNLIINACVNEHKTLEEIAVEVGKNTKYLKNKIFPRLLKEDKIERLYPTINHPNQAYKAKQ
jgi:ATP-dependent DNA helicase RecG